MKRIGNTQFVDMPNTKLGMCGEVLRRFAHAETGASSPTDLLWDLGSMWAWSESCARCLPEVFSELLPLLSENLDQARWLADFLVRFDFFESGEALVHVAAETGDCALMMRAAELAANPEVPPSARQRLLGVSPFGSQTLIRLDPGVQPSTVEEENLQARRWPGVRTDPNRFELSPVVVIDATQHPQGTLTLADLAVNSGAAIRRLGGIEPVPCWFGAQTVLVGGHAAQQRVLAGCPSFPVEQTIVEDIPSTSALATHLLRQINERLPGGPRLQLERHSLGHRRAA